MVKHDYLFKLDAESYVLQYCHNKTIFKKEQMRKNWLRTWFETVK